MVFTASAIVSYSNVSYETLVPAQWVYSSATSGVNFQTLEYTGGAHYVQSIGAYQLFDPTPNEWFTGARWLNNPWPGFIQNYARLWQNESWNPSGNTGAKTLSEWNALQADVAAGTKRNLVGTPVY